MAYLWWWSSSFSSSPLGKQREMPRLTMPEKHQRTSEGVYWNVVEERSRPWRKWCTTTVLPPMESAWTQETATSKKKKKKRFGETPTAPLAGLAERFFFFFRIRLRRVGPVSSLLPLLLLFPFRRSHHAGRSTCFDNHRVLPVGPPPAPTFPHQSTLAQASLLHLGSHFRLLLQDNVGTHQEEIAAGVPFVVRRTEQMHTPPPVWLLPNTTGRSIRFPLLPQSPDESLRHHPHLCPRTILYDATGRRRTRRKKKRAEKKEKKEEKVVGGVVENPVHNAHKRLVAIKKMPPRRFETRR